MADEIIIDVHVPNGGEVKTPDDYTREITENGLYKLQRMERYKVFVNVQ